ncbi:serine/threonine-protein kinase CBK1-like [Gastrolobium bilobum]|uniref:serine/threonine-protein kinase CBK1-like n=1 Tax=Gastrolobium bilobum TaxID=150636 RepID=UPI002AB18CC3|nr:serine/threonine-protein kinase CBK1-like [Gastrolobium bilobum]
MEQQQKKNYPSLPSNYVTLAQLQERWLKQHHQSQKQDEEKEQHPMHQNLQQQPDQTVVVPRNGTASKSHPAKVYQRKNRNDSVPNRRAVEVAVEAHRKSEADAGIGDEKAAPESEVSESKKKKGKKKWKGNRKPKVEEKGACEVAGAGAAAAQGNEENKKTTIESELNNKKSSDSVIVEKVEQKFGVLSMKSGNGKQDGRFRIMNEGFRHSQSQRNYYGYGHGLGVQHDKVRKQRKEDKMVWVRKDGIET